MTVTFTTGRPFWQFVACLACLLTLLGCSLAYHAATEKAGNA